MGQPVLTDYNYTHVGSYCYTCNWTSRLHTCYWLTM